MLLYVPSTQLIVCSGSYSVQVCNLEASVSFWAALAWNTDHTSPGFLGTCITLTPGALRKMNSNKVGSIQEFVTLQDFLEAVIQRRVTPTHGELLDQCNKFQPTPTTYHLLRAFHLSQWFGFLSHPSVISGHRVSMSTITFYLTAMHGPEVEDQPTTLRSFPLIHILPSWQHEACIDIPILSYSQQCVLDTLYGLEWHLISDIHVPERSAHWLRQVRSLLSLLLARVSFFVREKLDPSILDMENYRVLLPCTQPAVDPKVAHIRPRDATVNTDFLYVVDTVISTMEITLFNYGAKPPAIFPLPNIKAFTTWLFDSARAESEQYITGACHKWIENLVITESHRRIYLRTRGYKDHADNGHLLVEKSEDCIPPFYSSFRDIEQPCLNHTASKAYLAHDALFFIQSDQRGQVCKTIFWPDVHNVPPEGQIYICRDPVWRGYRIYGLGSAPRWAPSFTHAFVSLRHAMVSTGRPPVVRGVDISKYDTHF